jgi:hypothetical protein
MRSVEDILTIAEKFLGTTEHPSMSNKTEFGEWFPIDGEPWCAKFVSFVLDQAGITAYKHKFTPSGADLFKAEGRWTEGPGKRGDVAFFDFPGDSLFRISHVGFVTRREGDVYHTIEGNTSPPGGGSDRDGGGVFRRERHESLIVGFGRPASRGSGTSRILREGSMGRRVVEWQRDLNLAGKFGLDDDGEFGPLTREATEKWQRSQGLKPTGQVGKKVLRAMAEVLGKHKPKQTIKRPTTLRQGDEGQAVRRVQRRLAKRGFDLQGLGIFGPKTVAAVMEFQRTERLTPSGEVDPKTWRRLGL